MKYSTPRQRMKIYEKMVKAIDRGCEFYMCHYLTSVSCGYSLVFDFGAMFPELWNVRPRQVTRQSQAWFSEDLMQARKRKLLKAIELCKKQF